MTRPPPTAVPRIFLLSPASCHGARAARLLAPGSESPLARRLRDAPGVPLGEVFTYLSQLYFRGKIAYASTFARPLRPRSRVVQDGVLVITPSHGLVSWRTRVTAETLCTYAAVDLHAANPVYREALAASAARVREDVGAHTEVVLLGSIATPKYVDVLSVVFGTSLLFPEAFVGRGDMSRGALMLRSASSGLELEYVPVLGSVRTGRRAPRVG